MLFDSDPVIGKITMNKRHRGAECSLFGYSV